MKKDNVEKGYVVVIPVEDLRECQAISIPFKCRAAVQITKIVNIFSLQATEKLGYEDIARMNVHITTPGGVPVLFGVATFFGNNMRAKSTNISASYTEIGEDTFLISPALALLVIARNRHKDCLRQSGFIHYRQRCAEAKGAGDEKR